MIQAEYVIGKGGDTDWNQFCFTYNGCDGLRSNSHIW